VRRAIRPQRSLLDTPAPSPRASAQPAAMSSPTATPVSAERAPVSAKPAAESAEPVDLSTGWARATEEILKKKALLGSVVQHGVPLRLAGGGLTVALVASPLHPERL